MSRKSVKKHNSSPVLMNVLIKIALGVMVIVSLASIISSRSTVVEKQKELDAIYEKNKEIEIENNEYQQILDNDDINSYMEKLATENPELNYGIPNERRFYDTSRN